MIFCVVVKVLLSEYCGIWVVAMRTKVVSKILLCYCYVILLVVIDALSQVVCNQLLFYIPWLLFLFCCLFLGTFLKVFYMVLLDVCFDLAAVFLWGFYAI